MRTLLASSAGSHALLYETQRAAWSLYDQAVQLGNVRLLEEVLSSKLHERIQDNQRFLQRLVVSVVREGDAEMLVVVLQECHVNVQVSCPVDRQDDGAFPEPAPLLIAVEQDNERVVGVLLENGADPNVASSTPEKWSALHMAAEWGNCAVMPYWRCRRASSCGADVNARNSSGLTSLHIASIEGCASVMAVLLQHGALVNARDDNGCTPLHLGAFFDENDARFAKGVEDTQVAVVNLLVRHGADVEMRDAEGKTALQSAQRGKYDVIVNLLLDHIQLSEKKRRKRIEEC